MAQAANACLGHAGMEQEAELSGGADPGQEAGEFAERIQGRLDRLGLSPEYAARAAGLPADFIPRLLDGRLPPPRGQRLVKLAEALATSVSYLIGLDPDMPVPMEYLEEEQGSLGLLAGDEEALLRAYRRLDVPSRAALLQVVSKMTPDPEPQERKPRQGGRRGA